MPLIFCLATPVAAVVINGRTDPAATCDTIKVFGRKLDESARTRSAYSPTSASVDLEFLGPKLDSGHFLTVLGRTDVGKASVLIFGAEGFQPSWFTPRKTRCPTIGTFKE